MGLIDLNPSLRWPRGILPYAFDPAVSGVPSRLAIANQAIAEWSAKSHLRFVERTDEPGYLYFFYWPSGQCQSNVGYDGQKHNVNCKFASIGIVLHEMGHAIGLIHEHQRPDRDQHIVVSLASASPEDAAAFEITDKWHAVGPYDCVSIMHYDTTDPFISKKPGGCTTWGSQTDVSAGDGAAVRSMYRLVRRADSGDLAGEAKAIEASAFGADGVLTAVRTKEGNLKLITWRVVGKPKDVAPWGQIKRIFDSGAAGGAISEVSLARSNENLFFTAVRTKEGDLQLIAWGVANPGNITRRGDTGSAAGAAKLIRCAILGGALIVTACQTGSGNLKLIVWRSKNDGAVIERLNDSGTQAGSVSEIALCRVDGARRVVTAVRDSFGRLRLIVWDVGSSGTLTRRGDSASQAGVSTKIRIAAIPGSQDVVTASLTEAETLKLIRWRIASDGAVIRLHDSGDQAGAVLGHQLTVHGDRALSSARTKQGTLKVISWHLRTSQIDRIGDSGDEAGAIQGAVVADRPIRGNEVISAVRDSDGDLKLIQWLHV